jgi:hypothetical protein
MKRFTITIVLLVFISLLTVAWLARTEKGQRFRALYLPKTSAHAKPSIILPALKLKAKDARSFISKNNFNTRYCFLIDMSMPSGQKRFFIYNLDKDSIIGSGLVTHGNCNQDWLEGRRYENTVGCGCTSLGKYKIGNPYTGRFGLAFKLYGLEKTNSNAFSRYVVLHSHSCVPETITDTEICQSNGCPTVSPGFLKQLQLLINQTKKPVLLWIFE